jgi:glutaredoxin
VSTAVTLYGRPGCHLCDEARAALLRVRADVPFELREIDIDGDDELFKRYLERIPVVALNGEELFEFEVDEAALRRRLSLW